LAGVGVIALMVRLLSLEGRTAKGAEARVSFRAYSRSLKKSFAVHGNGADMKGSRKLAKGGVK